MYEKMKEELLAALENMLAGTFKVKTFKVHKNGKELEAFLITEEDSCVSPTFYFKDYLDDYMKGTSVERLALETIAVYFFTSSQIDMKVSDFRDFNSQKNGIVYKVVNAEQYAEQLPNIPYVKFFDLAIIFYCIIEISNEGTMGYVITNNILKEWNISKEALYEIAHQNLPKVLPLQIDSLAEMLFIDYSGTETMEEFVNNLPNDFMFSITNKYHRFGFANIFYPRLLQAFAERFGSFYILPSSTEEAIFVPLSVEMGISDMKEMVRTANQKAVMPDEFLSNSVYYYDAATGKIDAYL